MQRRVKTYGKRSTRIITISDSRVTSLSDAAVISSDNENPNNAPDKIKKTQTSSNHNSQHNKTTGNAPSQEGTRRNIKTKVITTNTTSRLALHPRSYNLGEDPISPLSTSSLDKPRESAPKSNRKQLQLATREAPSYAMKGRKLDLKQKSKAVPSSESSDDDFFPPQKSQQVGHRKTRLPSSSSESDSSILPKTTLSKPISTRSSKPVSKPANSKPSVVATKLQPKASKPRRIELSSAEELSDSDRSPVNAYGQQRGHGETSNLAVPHTPQIKAHHLRQARNRKATPFHRGIRISLDSTLSISTNATLSTPSDIYVPANRGFPTTPLKAISSNTSAQSFSSSPLTWENTVTPIMSRLRALDINDDSDTAVSSAEKAFLGLLAHAEQDAPIDFSDFLEMFKVLDLHQTHSTSETVSKRGKGRSKSSPLNELQYRKIGDASYSEVYGIGSVVLKIIPLDLDSVSPLSEAVDIDAEVPFKSAPEHVLKEITITSAMGEVNDGFIRLLRTFVVRGKYPAELLALWDAFEESRDNGGIRPSTFTSTQTYSIVVLPHGGVDLESFAFPKGAKAALGGKHDWKDAVDIFWQVARALGNAEEYFQFEHRDLHWGQIVIKKNEGDSSLKATIIDLGLSRMEKEGTVHFALFDEEIFTGKGVLSPIESTDSEEDDGITPDYQFDVYRMMKEHNGGEWETYRPFTNVMWLHYLSKKLLYNKGLKKPPAFGSLAAGKMGTSHAVELDAYNALVRVEKSLNERLKEIVHRIAPPKTIKKGKGPASKKDNSSVDLRDIRIDCAMDVVRLGESII